jgi:multiple sugar transport system permease protein
MRRNRELTIEQQDNLSGVFFILPALSILVLLVVYPILSGFRISLYNTNLVNRYNFVGLRYYKELLSRPDFYITVLTTFEISLLVVLGHFVAGGIFAGILNKPFRGRTVFRVILVLPWVMPEVSVGLIWKWILNPVYGLFNNYLLKLGLIEEPIAWLSNSGSAFVIVVFILIWKGFPLVMIMITAGLQTISTDVLEAATIDGANKSQLLLHVIFPSLKPVLLSALILDTLWWFKHFTLLYMVTGGGPGRTTTMVSIDIYLTAFESSRYGMASAMSVVVFAICMIISVIQRGVLREKA